MPKSQSSMPTSGPGRRATSKRAASVSRALRSARGVLTAERDSPRDQLIVTFFLLIVVGLLLFQAVRIRCAGWCRSDTGLTVDYARRSRREGGQRTCANGARCVRVPLPVQDFADMQALLPDRLQPISASIFDRVPGGRRTGLGNTMRETSNGRYAPVSVGS